MPPVQLLGLLLLPPLIYLGNPAIALAAGCTCTLLAGKPRYLDPVQVSRITLQTASVLLGLTLKVEKMWALSADYSVLITGYVLITLATGLLLGKCLRAGSDSSKLVSAGTAICGGTAVASLSPILRSPAEQTGSILAIIFILNAVALFVFPIIGHWLALDQTTFGLWCALAIHDTASVVATATLYGAEAAEVATTIKLGRTLWLIPLLLIFSAMAHDRSTKLRIPLFIVLFVAASIASSTLGLPATLLTPLKWLSAALLVIALFFIGTDIDRTTLRQIQGKALVQALLLWLAVVPLTLFIITRGGFQ